MALYKLVVCYNYDDLCLQLINTFNWITFELLSKAAAVTGTFSYKAPLVQGD